MIERKLFANAMWKVATTKTNYIFSSFTIFFSPSSFLSKRKANFFFSCLHHLLSFLCSFSLFQLFRFKSYCVWSILMQVICVSVFVLWTENSVASFWWTCLLLVPTTTTKRSRFDFHCFISVHRASYFSFFFFFR